ncbi:MAG: helicase, partial [Gammaproteobacteria bacterium]|nr:helicase [Gammaproteobacteria bacterium]
MIADWYEPLRDVRSLGSQTAKPGNLGGLHAARQEHLGQFFTVDSLARFAWELIQPAMARALARDGEGSRISLFDNSVGSGRLFQFADPTTHSLAGVDIHAPVVDRLSSVAEAAGFSCDFLQCGMEAVRARHYSVGLINPPFSLSLQSPLLEPYRCTTFGKYGPNSSTVSHAYALEQALDACDVVIAILPRTFARAVETDPSLCTRLAGVFDLPRSTFEEENADVAVTVLVFDALPRESAPVRASVSDLESVPPDLGLECRTDRVLSPRLKHKLMVDEGPVITLPVTNDATVRVTHDGRRLVLKYRCGLTQAKVANAVLRESIARYPHLDKRYPKQVRYTGDGALDLEVYLAQPDPLAVFQQFIELIQSAGGQPVVDIQVYQYIKRRARHNARDTVPLRHVIYAPAALDTGRIVAKAITTHALNPDSWLSPVIEAGETIEFVPVNVNGETRYRLDSKIGSYVLTYEQVLQRYAFQDVHGDWTVKHEGLAVRYPEIARNWIARARALDALIVVEPHLVPEMEREITSLPLTEADMEGEFSALGLDRSQWQVIRSPNDLDHLKRINVISYNRLRLALDGSRPKLTFARRLRRRIGILIADEGHLLRNMTSQQTRAIWMVSARKRYILSGTPVANYPRDIAPLLAYIADGTAAQPYGYYRPYLEP